VIVVVKCFDERRNDAVVACADLSQGPGGAAADVVVAIAQGVEQRRNGRSGIRPECERKQRLTCPLPDSRRN